MMWRFLRWGALIFFGTLYLFLFYALNFLRPSEYIGCDVYTKEMNGGVHAFAGKNYRIELCGIHGHTGLSNSGSDDAVHLKVFAMDGALLVERFFTPLSGMSSAMQLKYGDDFLMYRYETADMNQQEKITMPPSRWEWVRARLPRMWP